MLDAGVKSCWLVQPATESITIFADDDRPTTVATDTLDDPTTDTEVDLAEISDERQPLSLATGPAQISDSAMETTKERPDTYTEYERERGKPVPSVNHSRLQIRLSVAFFRYEPEYTVLSELALELNEHRCTPDLCVYPRINVDFQEDVVRMTEPPLLAVEILSPTQGQQDVMDRINDMLEAKVESCWLVQPVTETITLFTGDEKPTTVSAGTLRDPVTEIEVDVSDLFDEG